MAAMIMTQELLELEVYVYVVAVTLPPRRSVDLPE
jgi:hypothetical protein